MESLDMADSLVVLLSLLHRRVSVECRRDALQVLESIFGNICDHPCETRYRTVNTASGKWVRSVTSTFYVFQLIEWLKSKGFEYDSERSTLSYRHDGVGTLSQALVEVRRLRWAYDMPSRKLVNTERKLLPLLRVVVGLGTNGTSISGEAMSSKIHHISDDVWESVREKLTLTLLRTICSSQVCDATAEVSQAPLPTGNAAAWVPLLQATRETTLSLLEEDFAVVDAERFDAMQASGHATLSSQSDRFSYAVRQRVAERHKASFVANEDVNQHAKVHQEVQLVATRLIADIASCMEQMAVLEGDVGIVRKDRLEAKKLLKKFREDGDVKYLHTLREEWLMKLNEMKEMEGRHLVYL